MASTVLNPYAPGRGVSPPVLAGRTLELAAAERRLDALEAGQAPSQDLLFYGPRGNGKTTLLIEIRKRARDRRMRAETLPVDALTSRRRLVRHLQERAGLHQDQVTGIQVAGLGATADRATPSEDVEALLFAWVRAAAEPLVILLDEVHAIAPEEARPFFDAVQAAKEDSPPFLLVAAGTPGAPRALREAGTYNERGFERIRVGRLERRDTVTALVEPARVSGLVMAEDAVSLLAGESQDYPYFIQLLGSAAWRAAARSDTDGIGREAAERGVAACRPTLADFYEERYDEAWERRIATALAPLAELFTRREGQVEDAHVVSLLESLADRESIPFDVISLRNALRELGIIWQTSAGIWEMGIPSFADYVLRRDQSA